MENKRNIKLVIEYNGTGYHGWQIQQNAHTIQAELEYAIKRLTGEELRITGAGRTDVGVHALGQTANFYTCSSIPGERFADALNSILPKDISILSSNNAENNFHSRYSAKGKHYRYMILNRKMRSAIYEGKAWHLPSSLNLSAMSKAASYFTGSHDFTSFCASGSSAKTFTRNIQEVLITQKEDFIVFDTIGEGFLYNMVRIMIGTLVDVGIGKKAPNDIREIINSRSRNSAGRTAPACGLYLVEVYY